MRKHIRALASIPLFGVALGCGDDDEPDACDTTAQTRSDPTADFTAFETFAIAPDEAYPDPPPEDLPEDAITDFKNANADVANELEALGLTEVDAEDDPDLVVFTAAASEDKDAVVWECVPGWSWWGWWYTWDPCAWLQPVPVDYSVGTVVVGLANPNTEEVVFGGVVQGVLDCGNTDQRLSDAISDVFDDYPADQTGD